jgi:hypothetical protein
LALTLVSSALGWLAMAGLSLYIMVCVCAAHIWRLLDFLQTRRAENKKRRAVALNKYYAWCGACSVCIKAARVFPFYPRLARSKQKQKLKPARSLSAVIKVW